MKYPLRPTLIALSAVALGVTGCSSLMYNNSFSNADDIQPIEPVDSTIKRISLEQAWDDKTKEQFWFTSQGSQIIPYSWFTWLEVADSKDLFRSSDHMSYLGYLPEPPSDLNPSGLPIGFALNKDTKGDAWVGMTCSACHTNQLDYQGNKFLIEGAPTLANFVLFFDRLTEAMNATNTDEIKFQRFAKNVLAEQYSVANAAQLRLSFTDMSIKIAQRQQVNALPSSLPKDFTSYARLDAFGNIQNEGTAFALHDLTNKNVPDAPVSYPFLWGTHQSDVVQWNASAPNTPVVGPLSRNMGEVVGVFGGLSIEEAPWWKRLIGLNTSYSSSVDMLGLGQLETWVKALRSPQWPAQYLPPINTQQAAAGSILYQEQCSGCHQVMTREQEKDLYLAVRTPVKEVGTDPMTAWNAEFHQAKTLVLEGEKQLILAGDKFGAEADAISIPVNGVVGLILKDPKTALKAGLMPLGDSAKGKVKSLKEYALIHAKSRDAIQQPVDANKPFVDGKLNLTGLVYKARPLNGIWATAPYMHNGSVANLWETLQKPEDRQTAFWVGNRNFDPKVVGYVNEQADTIGQYPSPSSEFNVLDSKGDIAKGNSNRGHDFGTDLTDAEKWQLVEYMKTL